MAIYDFMGFGAKGRSVLDGWMDGWMDLNGYPLDFYNYDSTCSALESRENIYNIISQNPNK